MLEGVSDVGRDLIPTPCHGQIHWIKLLQTLALGASKDGKKQH